LRPRAYNSSGRGQPFRAFEGAALKPPIGWSGENPTGAAAPSRVRAQTRILAAPAAIKLTFDVAAQTLARCRPRLRTATLGAPSSLSTLGFYLPSSFWLPRSPGVGGKIGGPGQCTATALGSSRMRTVNTLACEWFLQGLDFSGRLTAINRSFGCSAPFAALLAASTSPSQTALARSIRMDQRSRGLGSRAKCTVRSTGG